MKNPTPVITLHVHSFGDAPLFTVDVPSPHNATFRAEISLTDKLESEPGPRYLVQLRGMGLPALSSVSSNTIAAALHLAGQISEHLDEVLNTIDEVASKAPKLASSSD